jgi:hypothetical protein
MVQAEKYLEAWTLAEAEGIKLIDTEEEAAAQGVPVER